MDSPVLALYDPFGVDVPKNFDIINQSIHLSQTEQMAHHAGVCCVMVCCSLACINGILYTFHIFCRQHYWQSSGQFAICNHSTIWNVLNVLNNYDSGICSHYKPLDESNNFSYDITHIYTYSVSSHHGNVCVSLRDEVNDLHTRE